MSLNRRDVNIKTASSTLTPSERGDVIVNSSSTTNQIVPNPLDGLWYDISNIGSGVVSVKYLTTLITTLNQNEKASLRSDGTSWYMSKGGGTTVNGESGDIVIAAGSNVTVTKDGRKITIDVDASGASTFTELTDTPDSYSGQAGKFVIVNSAENGLEFSKITHVSGIFDYGFITDVTTSSQDWGIIV